MAHRQHVSCRCLAARMLLLGALTTSAACTAREFSAEPLEAYVVDAKTRQPLEGVIATANWELERGTFGGNVVVGQLMVMEAVTDKNGRFYFPAWGPKRAKEGHFVDKDPQLLFFKPGYAYLRLLNKYPGGDREARLRPVRRSDWHGKTIALEPFTGSLREYAEQLARLEISLDFARYGVNCEWKMIPRMLLAKQAQKDQFEKQRIRNSLSSIEYVGEQNRCGSAKDFFRRYNQ